MAPPCQVETEIYRPHCASEHGATLVPLGVARGAGAPLSSAAEARYVPIKKNRCHGGSGGGTPSSRMRFHHQNRACRGRASQRRLRRHQCPGGTRARRASTLNNQVMYGSGAGEGTEGRHRRGLRAASAVAPGPGWRQRDATGITVCPGWACFRTALVRLRGSCPSDRRAILSRCERWVAPHARFGFGRALSTHPRSRSTRWFPRIATH